jgi:hypothetical protein
LPCLASIFSSSLACETKANLAISVSSVSQ